jgi:hypothetical protein
VLGEPVVRIRTGASPGSDRYGNPLPGTETEATLTGAAFDPGGSLEPVEVGRTAVVTTPKLYFQSAVDVTAGDRMRVRGVTYTVEGTPALWVSPFTTQTAGTVVELRAVAG